MRRGSLVDSLQVCAAHDTGCKTAVHLMHFIFKEENTVAVLLIDASNTFNMMNKMVFLHNIAMVCPTISTYVFNCYARQSRLFVFGEYGISSVEGTIQVDLIDMSLYVVVLLRLTALKIMITISEVKFGYYPEGIQRKS